MLLQLHHQFKYGTTQMCSQREINSSKENEEWIEETKKSHPLPEGAEWMACNEQSEYFVRTRIKDLN